jgi:hypothetical protein
VRLGLLSEKRKWQRFQSFFFGLTDQSAAAENETVGFWGKFINNVIEK